MQYGRLTGSTLFLAALALTGCGGGDGSNSGSVTPGVCGEAAVFCLTSCNIGCVNNGCEIREIAQNQRLRFQFSQPVDVGTVDFSTVSLKTPQGRDADGSFVVEDTVITFIPAVRNIGAQTFFGFVPNEEYILTLPGGEAPVSLRSTSGDGLTDQFSCSMRVTLGIIDIDNQPPSARVVSPNPASDIPRDAQFVLEFSEVVDQGAFIQSPNGPDAPVVFELLQRNQTGGCETGASSPPQIFGTTSLTDDPVRGVTTLTFRPAQQLPGNRCIQARLTGRVRDLSGRSASPLAFLWRTDATSVVLDSVVEDFSTAQQFDNVRSAGTWGNGSARFLNIGGDGRHGDFDHTAGVVNMVNGDFEFDTAAPWMGNETAIVPNEVVNGEYFFTRFVIPDGVTVRFFGTFPARIHVRGECDIRGNLIFSGSDVERYTAVSNATGNQPGQPGGRGGPGGGAGGDGAQQGSGLNASTLFNGDDGDDLNVPMNHAFAGQEVNTGGRGSRMFPINGQQAMVTFTVFGSSGLAAHGGGGGGFLQAGSTGRVIDPGASVPSPMLPPVPPGSTAGGVQFDLNPIPGNATSEHFLVSGSGGGGGASHPFYRRAPTASSPSSYMAGAAGAGGGGSVLFRVGSRFRIGPTGLIENRGGSGEARALTNGIGQLLPCPGGGGSGGSLVMQVGSDDDIELLGTVDTRGGNGGSVLISGSIFQGQIQAGSGGDGIYRFETPTELNPAVWNLSTLPAPAPINTGVLTESDDLVAIQSRLYDTSLAVPPSYLRYEVDVRNVGSTQVTTFSDDPAVGMPAIPGAMIQFFVQGIAIDPLTGQPLSIPRPTEWFRGVGFSPDGGGTLNSEGRSGFRWAIALDRTIATDVEITRVELFYSF